MLLERMLITLVYLQEMFNHWLDACALFSGKRERKAQVLHIVTKPAESNEADENLMIVSFVIMPDFMAVETSSLTADPALVAVLIKRVLSYLIPKGC